MQLLSSVVSVYDTAGLLSKITHENGDNISYTYDAANQLKSEIKKTAAGAVIYSYAYTYDAAKNRASMVKNGVTTNYAYNNLNQLTTAGSTTYSYDSNGNMVTSVVSASTTSYVYDLENRLTKITYPGTTPVSTFSYDGDGRKVKVSEGTTVTNHLFDGPLPVIERNSSNVTQVTYTRALGAPGGIGGLISQTRSGVTTWFHNIHNGPTNVSHLTNSSAAVAQRYEFDAFGNLTYQSGSTTNNYRFQTKELHPQSNLVYFGARWYNPAIGRWITPDQLGIIDGPNLYCYLSNNPINDIDPWGLCAGVGDKKDKDRTKKVQGRSFWGRLGNWWNRLYPAPFKWWDFSSWLFPGTNYCGATKSGPGEPTSRCDACCQPHDWSLHESGYAWWQITNKNVRDYHEELINCWARNGNNENTHDNWEVLYLWEKSLQKMQ